MIYTLSQGARGYDNKLHYSLYGGVEHELDRSFSFKELVSLIAIPVVAIAFIFAILNFHIPVLSPTTGDDGRGVTNARSGSSAALLISKPSSASLNNGRNGSSSGSSTSTASGLTGGSLSTPQLTPLGNDNGQGIIGGMGGGGGTTTPIVDPTGTTDTVKSTLDSIIQPSASVSTTGTTTTVDATVTVPLTGTSTNINKTIDP